MRLSSAIYADFYPFNKLFDSCRQVFRPEHLTDDSVLLLWGGEDISPSIYGQQPEYTYAPDLPSIRDRMEINLVGRAVELGLPIIAVCRGAQLMCCLSGGSLYQHVNNHAGQNHILKLDSGGVIASNSYHHQMMNLNKRDGKGKVDHHLIGWVDPVLGTQHKVQGGDAPKPDLEPEIVYFPRTKALCIQGHPEYLTQDNPFTKYCVELVQQYTLAKQ